MSQYKCRLTFMFFSFFIGFFQFKAVIAIIYFDNMPVKISEFIAKIS